MPRKKGWSGGKRRDWKRIWEDRQFGQRLSDGEEEEREVKQGVVDEGEVNLNNSNNNSNNSVLQAETLTSGLMNMVESRPRNVEPSPGPSTSTVLAEEAIELAAKGAKEKLKKKARIEEMKKKFKDQVRKMSSEEIRQHILKLEEKADKLLKKEQERKRGKKRLREEEEESRGMGWWGEQPESGAEEQEEHDLFRGCLFDSHCHLNLVMR